MRFILECKLVLPFENQCNLPQLQNKGENLYAYHNRCRVSIYFNPKYTKDTNS